MAKSSGNQTTLGKAFEYACVKALYEKYKDVQNVVIEDTPQMRTAKNYYKNAGNKQNDLSEGALAAVRAIDRLEPRLKYPDMDIPLVLSVQPDSAGIAGDVRDVLCIRKGHRWEIGLSCKHNHYAVKHSRLSDKIDFGKEWFGHPCSRQYFDEVVPKFTELRILRDDSKKAGNPALWSDLSDKMGDYYEPILQSFMDELSRLSETYSDVPEKLIEYLIGRYDFYKVVTNDARRITRIEAINIAGTLNSASEGHKPITTVPVLKKPSKFYHIGFKEENGVKSQNTIHVVCDNGWEISMRLHNASSRIEPSLKFDVQLISFPSSLFAQVEPWD
jgi:hypothetical protein